MEHIEANNVFLDRSIARKIKKKIGNSGFITHVKEVSRSKIGEVDMFRIVLYHSDLRVVVEKITKTEINWENINKSE